MSAPLKPLRALKPMKPARPLVDETLPEVVALKALGIGAAAEAVMGALAKLPEKIVDETMAVRTSDGLNAILEVKKNLERARRNLVDPLNAKVKEVNDAFRPWAKLLADGEERAKALILRWRREEQARVQREAEEARREAEARAAAEAAAAKPPVAEGAEAPAVPAVMSPRLPLEPAEPAKTTHGALGTVTARTIWTFSIVDPDAVPREFCVVSETLIRDAVRGGAREIPGVRIYQEEQLAGRRY